MKHIIKPVFSVTLVMLISFSVQAQERTLQKLFPKTTSQSTFYEIQKEAGKLWGSHVDMDKMTAIDKKNYKKYLRWETFWVNRFDENRGFSGPAKELVKYAQTKSKKNNDKKVDPGLEEWTPIGPYGINVGPNELGMRANRGGIGAIHTAAYDPTAQTIYAASSTGGLFKTTNDANRNKIIYASASASATGNNFGETVLRPNHYSMTSQFVCGIENNNPERLSATCDQSAGYIPNSSTSTKYVSITLHVIQKDDGTGNFKNTQVEKDWLINSVVGTINWRMRTLQPMNLPTTSPLIEDSKIQYVVNRIFFHKNTGLRDFSGGIVQYSKINALHSQYVTNNPEVINKTNSIHTFLVEGSGSQGIACGLSCSNWTVISNIYTRYQELPSNSWGPAAGLRHEYGHNLGLWHSWQNDGCDDTPTHNNCWNGPNCSNNVMDYNAPKSALTESQLGKMHCQLENDLNSLLVPECPADIDLLLTANGSVDESFEAANNITSSRVYNQSYNIIYKAGKSINLTNGFKYLSTDPSKKMNIAIKRCAQQGSAFY